MKTNDAIAIAAVIIVILLLVYYVDQKNMNLYNIALMGNKGFTPDNMSHNNNHQAQQAQQSQRAHQAQRAQPQHHVPPKKTAAEKAKFDPESFLAMEQSHRNLVSARQPHHYEPEQHGNNTTHGSIGDMDFNSYITDQVADPKVRENHKKWVNEIKPWAGTAARTNDDMSEAMEASVHFVGLRRPQAVKQYNPHQVTEVDESTFTGNKKFNFAQSE
jgi:hypothetical protein